MARRGKKELEEARRAAAAKTLQPSSSEYDDTTSEDETRAMKEAPPAEAFAAASPRHAARNDDEVDDDDDEESDGKPSAVVRSPIPAIAELDPRRVAATTKSPPPSISRGVRGSWRDPQPVIQTDMDVEDAVVPVGNVRVTYGETDDVGTVGDRSRSTAPTRESDSVEQPERNPDMDSMDPYDYLLKHFLGFPDEAERDVIRKNTFTDLDELRYVTEKDIHAMVDSFAKRSKNDGRIHFGLSRTQSMIGLMHWVQDRVRCNSEINVYDVNNSTFRQAIMNERERKSELDKMETHAKSSSPGKLNKESEWVDWLI
jgi:hypothetical protein